MPSYGRRSANRITNRRAVLVTAAGSALALFGVGGPDASAGSGASGSRPRTRRHYEGVGLRLTPAPRDAVPALSAAQAISAFRDNWTWPGGRPHRAELFVGSDGFHGRASTRDAGRTGDSTFTDQLVWVLSWRGVGETVHGPASLPARDRERLRRETTFTGVGVVDASTGEVLMIFSTGRRR